MVQSKLKMFESYNKIKPLLSCVDLICILRENWSEILFTRNDIKKMFTLQKRFETRMITVFSGGRTHTNFKYIKYKKTTISKLNNII